MKKKKQTMCVATVVALLGITSLAADTVALTAARDTTIFSRNNQASNALGVLFTSTTNQGNIRRSLLAFDVAAVVPAGSTVTAAVLTLTLNEAAGDGMDLDHRLHRLRQEWGEGTSFSTSGNGAAATSGDATWSARLFPDTLWSATGGDFEATPSANAVVGDSSGPIAWGSTPLMIANVQQWLDFPDENHGWIVLGNENVPGTARKFVNREDADPAIRPTLTIVFTVPPPPEPATFIVTKEWLIVGAAAAEVAMEATLSVFCDNEIFGGFYNGSEYQYDKVLSGDGESFEVSVDTSTRSAVCRAEEIIAQSGVEVASDCGPRSIPAGGSSSCTITNTVFFEGIPTLDQVGMALLILIVSGIGMLYFKRFA